jgi:hypothetical protein
MRSVVHGETQLESRITAEVARELEQQRAWERAQAEHHARVRRRMRAQHTGVYDELVAEWRRLTPSDTRTPAEIAAFLMYFMSVAS